MAFFLGIGDGEILVALSSPFLATKVTLFERSYEQEVKDRERCAVSLALELSSFVKRTSSTTDAARERKGGGTSSTPHLLSR